MASGTVCLPSKAAAFSSLWPPLGRGGHITKPFGRFVMRKKYLAIAVILFLFSIFIIFNGAFVR